MQYLTQFLLTTTFKEELTKKGTIFCPISESYSKTPRFSEKISRICNTNY